MAKRKLPVHIPGTVEQWRRRKRREWRAVTKALETFQFGAAYTPASMHLGSQLRVAVGEISLVLKGRWNP